LRDVRGRDVRYLGGKAKLRKYLCPEIAKHRAPGQVLWEPFCGGLNSAVGHGGLVVCSDVSIPLIALLLAVRAGWDPPHEVSEAEWRAAKTLPPTDPRHGFCAFGCSFGGDDGGGYARDGSNPRYAKPGHNYAREARNTLLRDAPIPAAIFLADFLAIEPRPLSALIYCDPPYRGRRGYGAPFDHDRFVARCRAWARFTTVLVSEYEFPGELLWSREKAAGLRGRESVHVERLYKVNP
jgi:hypothetical protein